MEKKSHNIWGDLSRRKKPIPIFKNGGIKKTYFLEERQKPVVKENKDAIYISKGSPRKVHQFFAFVQPRKKKYGENEEK